MAGLMGGSMVVGILIVLALAVPQKAGALNEPLRPLQFLVGSCWTGAFPDGKSTDTHCFESVFEGKFVRDRHVVRGGKQPYEGETLYAWDKKQNRVIYTYWASDGAISTGTMEPGDGGITFPESYAAEQGGMNMKMRNVWSITGRDTYDVVVSQWKGGGWREMWRMTMRRDPR
jgi:hypothetical protein